MTVEQYPHVGKEVAHQRHAGGQLVDEKGIGLEGLQFAGELGDGQEEIEVAQDGEEDFEAREEGRGEERGAADADVEGSCKREREREEAVSSRLIV